MAAPHCKQINDELSAICLIKTDVEKMALERAKYEAIDKDPRLSTAGDRFHNNLQAWAMFKLAYYQCFKCKKPYFGGMKDCIRA